MMRKIATGLGVLILAAACEPQSTDTSDIESDVAAASAPFADVTAPYETPFAENRVTGAAFWTSPDVSFRSAVATLYEGQALVLFDTDLLPLDQRGDAFSGGVDLRYAFPAPGGEALIAAHSAEENAFRFFSMDPETRTLIDLDGAAPFEGPVAAMCLAQPLGGAVTLHAVSDTGRYEVIAVDIADGAVATSPLGASTPEPQVTSCAADDDEGFVYFGDVTGGVFRIDMAAETQTPSPVPVSGLGSIAGLAVLTQADGAGYLLAASTDGVINLFDRIENAHAGGFRVIDAFDVDAVEDITALAAYGGNMGGVYRNGVVAVGDGADDRGANLKLVPWSAVANALQIEIGAALNPRGGAPAVEDADDGLNFTLDGVPAEIVGEGESGGQNE